MADAYPYTISNNKLEPFLARIRTAARPERLGQDLLAKWGFTASNDRAMPPLLRALGFLNQNNGPTPFYDRLRDINDWQFVLAERLREAYSDLFSIDPNIYKAPEQEIKGAMTRITGKDEETVKRYLSTFRTLAALAKFESRVVNEETVVKNPETTNTPIKPVEQVAQTTHQPARKAEYHYNIQIHLPVTTDITVYNAIFRSLKDNLGM